MKLILKERVENLGEPGDVVDVKPGYGRNFLVPKGLAMPATEGSLRNVRQLKRAAIAKAEEQRQVAEELAERLSEVELRFERKAAEGDTLYGSVSATDVAEALAGEGFDIDKGQVKLEHAIKSIGVREVSIGLSQGVPASVKVWVLREGEEAAPEGAEAAQAEPAPEAAGSEAAGEIEETAEPAAAADREEADEGAETTGDEEESRDRLAEIDAAVAARERERSRD